MGESFHATAAFKVKLMKTRNEFSFKAVILARVAACVCVCVSGVCVCVSQIHGADQHVRPLQHWSAQMMMVLMSCLVA